MKASLELLRLWPARARGGAQGSVVQSLLFPEHGWTVDGARKWARAHGYRDSVVEVPGPQSLSTYIRLPQRDPARLQRLRTIVFGYGIKAVVGWPQGGRAKPKGNGHNGHANGHSNGLSRALAVRMRGAGDQPRAPSARSAVARAAAELIRSGARVRITVGRSTRRG